MDFKQLRAFLTVVEAAKVTRAAEVLHLVQADPAPRPAKCEGLQRAWDGREHIGWEPRDALPREPGPLEQPGRS